MEIFKIFKFRTIFGLIFQEHEVENNGKTKMSTFSNKGALPELHDFVARVPSPCLVATHLCKV